MESKRIITGNAARDLETGEISVEIVSGILPVGEIIHPHNLQLMINYLK